MQGPTILGRALGKDSAGQKEMGGRVEHISDIVSFGEARSNLSMKLAEKHKMAIIELDKLEELKQLMGEIVRYKEKLEDKVV